MGRANRGRRGDGERERGKNLGELGTPADGGPRNEKREEDGGGRQIGEGPTLEHLGKLAIRQRLVRLK